jgi:transcriptional regulator with XRE-family HTH domain
LRYSFLFSAKLLLAYRGILVIALEKLRENIRYFREQFEWTQQELADKINISRSVLTRWENGSLIPDLHALLKLSHIFDVSLDGLIGRNYDKNMILQEVRRIYKTDEQSIDEEMIEVIRYLNSNGEIKKGLVELSRTAKKNRRPIEEIIKVTIHEIIK